MEHHIIIVDLEKVDPLENTRTVKVDQNQLQQLEDCENFAIIDPLTNQIFCGGSWQPIPTAVVKEFNGILTVE